MQKTVKLSLKGKTSGNGRIERIFMIGLGVILFLSRDYLFVNDHYSETKLLVYSQMSGGRLLDHWFSGWY